MVKLIFLCEHSEAPSLKIFAPRFLRMHGENIHDPEGRILSNSHTKRFGYCRFFNL